MHAIKEKGIIFFFIILWGVMGFSFWKQMEALSQQNPELLISPEKSTVQEEHIEKKIAPSLEGDEVSSIKLAPHNAISTDNSPSPRGENKETLPLAETPPETHEEEPVSSPIKNENLFLSQYARWEATLPYPRKQEPITENEVADRYLRAKAESRGYHLRPQVEKDELHPLQDNGKTLYLQPAMMLPFLLLQASLSQQGISLHLRSAYRSPQEQRLLFLAKLGEVEASRIPLGDYDAQIEEALKTRSLPGYSKHHSGYAIDLSCAEEGKLSYGFSKSSCYQALAKDNFALARKYGFIPSYPYGIEQQGPDPEPWEFVWIGLPQNEAS